MDFCFLLKIWGEILVKIWAKGKSLSSKYSQKRLDHAKQSTKDALKTTSEKSIEKKQMVI